MAFLSSMNIAASGLSAQQLRLDVIAENITNAATTRTEAGGPYRRKLVVLQAEAGRDTFQAAMLRAAGGLSPGGAAGGVRVTEIAEDPSPLRPVFDPTHPDADEEGYVSLPNVDMVKEMADAMAATQAYSANVTALNALKAVVAKGLEFGR